MRLATALLLLQGAFAADVFLCPGNNITSNPSAPKKTHCGDAGTATRRAFRIFSTSYSDCQISCLSDDSCTYYAYNFNQNQCSIWHVPKITFAFSSASNMYFWQPECFVVPQGAFYPTTAILNGNFANGSLNHWTTIGGNVSTEQYSSQGGSGYLAVIQVFEGSSGSDVENGLLQTFTPCSNATYTLSYSFLQVTGGTEVPTGDSYNTDPVFFVALGDPNGDTNYITSSFGVSSDATEVIIGNTGQRVPAGQSAKYSTPATFKVQGQWGFYLLADTGGYNEEITAAFTNISLTYAP